METEETAGVFLSPKLVAKHELTIMAARIRQLSHLFDTGIQANLNRAADTLTEQIRRDK